jgi:AcrR family transcriptional regulator
MARIVNEQEYTQKRNEILDAAQRLVYTIGYEKMTIQDILDDLKMSKGAFYHYFCSKNELLEGLIAHMIEGVIEVLQPIAENPQLSGLEKINLYFNTTATWKTARKPFFLALLKSWYSDENLVVREKSQAATFKLAAPILNQMVAQAVQEGSLNTPYSDFAGEIIFTLFLGLGEAMVDSLLIPQPGPEFERILNAYTSAIERILGVEHGKIIFMEPHLLDEWRIPAEK